MVCKPKGNVQNIYGGFVLGVWCVSLKEGAGHVVYTLKD